MSPSVSVSDAVLTVFLIVAVLITLLGKGENIGPKNCRKKGADGRWQCRYGARNG